MTSVSGRELARLVERRGWQLLRVNGSHHIAPILVASFGL
jgi:predicted RNA binding protein YcfA (HicA-like mRNA interferase family)